MWGDLTLTQGQAAPGHAAHNSVTVQPGQTIAERIKAGLGTTKMFNGASYFNKVPAYCIEFPEGDSDKFFVGAEDYTLY